MKQKFENVKLKKHHLPYSSGYGNHRYQGKNRHNSVWSSRQEAEAAWRQNRGRSSRYNMDSSSFKNSNWKSISSRFGQQNRPERHVIYSNGQKDAGLSDTGLKCGSRDLRINLTIARQRQSIKDPRAEEHRSNSTMVRALQVSKTVSENFDLSWNKKPKVTASNGVSLNYSDEENEDGELRMVSRVNSKKTSESSWLARCYRKRKSLDAALDAESELDAETSKLDKTWSPITNHIEKVPRVDSPMSALPQSRRSIAEAFMLEEDEILDCNKSVHAEKRSEDYSSKYNTKNKMTVKQSDVTDRLDKDPTYWSQFDRNADLLMQSILQQKFISIPASSGVNCSRSQDLGSGDSLTRSVKHLSTDKKSSSLLSSKSSRSESNVRSRVGSESNKNTSRSSSSSSSYVDSENDNRRKRSRHKSSSLSNKSDSHSNKRFRRRSGRSTNRSHSHSKTSKADQNSQHLSGSSANWRASKHNAKSRHYSSGNSSPYSSSSSSDRSSSTNSYCSSSSSDRSSSTTSYYSSSTCSSDCSSSTASSSSDVSERSSRSRHHSASSTTSHSSIVSKDKPSTKQKNNYDEDSELNKLLTKIKNYEKDYNTVVHGQQDGSQQSVASTAKNSKAVSPHQKTTRLEKKRSSRLKKNVNDRKKSLQRNVFENKPSNRSSFDNCASDNQRWHLSSGSCFNSDNGQRYNSSVHNKTGNSDDRQQYPCNMPNSTVHGDNRQRYSSNTPNNTVHGDNRQRYSSNTPNNTVHGDNRQRYSSNTPNNTVHGDNRQRYSSSMSNSTVHGDNGQRYSSNMPNSTADIGVRQQCQSSTNSTVHQQPHSDLGTYSKKGTSVGCAENRHPASYWLTDSPSQSYQPSDSSPSISSSESSKSSENSSDSSSESSSESSSASSSTSSCRHISSCTTAKTEPVKQETCSSYLKESDSCGRNSKCLQPVKKEEEEVKVKREVKDDGIENDKDSAKDICEKLKMEPVENCRLQKVCDFTYLAADEVDSLDVTLTDTAADLDPYRLQRSPTPMGFSMPQISSETDLVRNLDCTEEQPCKGLKGCFDSGVCTDEAISGVQDNFQRDVVETCQSRNVEVESVDKEQFCDSPDVSEGYSGTLDAMLEYDSETLERNRVADGITVKTADHQVDDGAKAAMAVSICPYSSSDEDLDNSVKCTEIDKTPVTEKLELDSEDRHMNSLSVKATEKEKLAKETENATLEVSDDKRFTPYGRKDVDTELATADLSDGSGKDVVKGQCAEEYMNPETNDAMNVKQDIFLKCLPSQPENKTNTPVEEILIRRDHVSVLPSASSEIPNGLECCHELSAESNNECRNTDRKSDLKVDSTQNMTAELAIPDNQGYVDNDGGEIIFNLTSEDAEKTAVKAEETSEVTYGDNVIDPMIEASPLENTQTFVVESSVVNSFEVQDASRSKRIQTEKEDASCFFVDDHRALPKAEEEIKPCEMVDIDKTSMHIDVADEVAQIKVLQTPLSNPAVTIDDEVDCFLRQIRFNTATKVDDGTPSSATIVPYELENCTKSRSVMPRSCESLTDSECSEKSPNVNVDAFAKNTYMESNSEEWERKRHPEKRHPEAEGIETICMKENHDVTGNISHMSNPSEETCHSGTSETLTSVSEMDANFSTGVSLLRASSPTSDDSSSLEDHISAPILKSIKEKQAGLEKDFQKDCEVMVSVTKFLLSKDPGLQARLESCLHECLTELSDRFVESFQEYMTKVKQGRISPGNN